MATGREDINYARESAEPRTMIPTSTPTIYGSHDAAKLATGELAAHPDMNNGGLLKKQQVAQREAQRQREKREQQAIALREVERQRQLDEAKKELEARNRAHQQAQLRGLHMKRDAQRDRDRARLDPDERAELERKGKGRRELIRKKEERKAKNRAAIQAWVMTKATTAKIEAIEKKRTKRRRREFVSRRSRNEPKRQRAGGR